MRPSITALAHRHSAASNRREPNDSGHAAGAQDNSEVQGTFQLKLNPTYPFDEIAEAGFFGSAPFRAADVGNDLCTSAIDGSAACGDAG